VRWHVMRVVEAEANGRSAKSAQSVSKLFWSELWQDLTAFGLRCGCAQHKSLWQYQYLRARAGTIYAGTSEIQRNMIARLLMKSN
jgi:alkylation response protein AidB-like acyl-CoA dehydrogenase